MKRSEIRKLDKEFSLLIRGRGFCENGGEVGGKCGGVLHCSHIIRRGIYRLRWEPRNALALCTRHHLFWWHREPLEATKWFQKKFGTSRHDWLLKMSRVIDKSLTPEIIRSWWKS